MPHRWNIPRPATLKDVARDVGVCEATVSVILNGSKSGTRVSEKTRTAVQSAAARLGYRPNGQARSLVSGRTGRIAAYSGSSIIDDTNIFFVEVMCGMLAGCRETAFNLMIHGATSCDDALMSLISSRSVDGILVIANEDDPILPILNDLKVPAVAIGDDVPGLPSVTVDDVQGGTLQAQYLHMKGHRRVIYRGAKGPYRSAKTRKAAFLQTAADLGMNVLVTQETTSYMFGLLPEESSALQSGNRPTAIVGWEDLAAHRICNAIEDVGLNVGRDVAVVAFNGFHPMIPPKFRLTTIFAPWFQVGEGAVTLLSDLIHRRSIPLRTVLPVSLVQGDTA